MSYSDLVSVIIPTYNRANFLPEAIDSVLAQTFKKIELIIIDDGSTDNTDEIIKKYEGCLTYVKQKNLGVSAARNHGISIANGNFIGLLDSDDIWLPEKLTKQIALFQKYPDTGMAGGGCKYVNQKNQEVGRPLIPAENITNCELEIYTAMPGSISNCLIKKSVLDKIGYFNEEYAVSEDRDLYMRISRNYPVRAVQEATVVIRLHNAPRGDNRSLRRVLSIRKKINKTIPSRILRRKANAWLYYNLFTRVSKDNKAKALYFIGLSFLYYPLRILPQLRRAQPLIEHYLPDKVYSFVVGIVKKVS